MKKNLLNIIIIIISAFVLFIYIFCVDNPMYIIEALKSVNIPWIICACSCMGIYWLFESLSLYMISNALNKKLNFKNALQISMVGQLFNCITPFSSGGQPIQAYYMVKYGMNIGEASCVLLGKFIVFQTVLTLYSLFVLIFRFKFFIDNVSNFAYLVIIGFMINLIVVVCLTGIGFFPVLTKKFIFRIINILSHFKIIKEENKILENINLEIDNFYNGFLFLKQNIKTMVKTTVVIILQLTIFFIIPYFICLSLNATNTDLFTVISSSAFVLMISSFIPLPGASGGAESSFYLFFGIFFKNSGTIGIAILIWRIITFYIPILIGILFSKMANVKMPSITT